MVHKCCPFEVKKLFLDGKFCGQSELANCNWLLSLKPVAYFAHLQFTCNSLSVFSGRKLSSAFCITIAVSSNWFFQFLSQFFQLTFNSLSTLLQTRSKPVALHFRYCRKDVVVKNSYLCIVITCQLNGQRLVMSDKLITKSHVRRDIMLRFKFVHRQIKDFNYILISKPYDWRVGDSEVLPS